MFSCGKVIIKGNDASLRISIHKYKSFIVWQLVACDYKYQF